MYQPRKWWIGLPLVAALFALAAAFNTQKIEDDIAGRVRTGLAESTQALDNPQATASGRDVSVSGFALSESAKQEALANAARQLGVRKVLDATTPLPAVKPFVFTLERAGGRVTLGGNLPPTGERDKIKAAAAAIGGEPADNAGYASGAPPAFADLATFAIAQLARLDPGKVTLADNALSISGQAKTAADYEKALAALKSPPAGAVVAAVEISAPRVSPYVWSATRGGETIALSGSIPSNDLRAGIAANAASIAGATVKDETHVGSGAPPGDFAAAVAFALMELGRLTQGKVVLTDAKLTIEGAGKENVSAASIAADARASLPKGFELTRTEVAPGSVSPYTFAARKSGATLTLSGYAPDDAARQRMLADARRRFFDVGVVDELAIATGAPKNFAEATSASLYGLARLSEGNAKISGTDAILEGAAFHEKAASDIQSRFDKALPQGFKGEARISARTAGPPVDAAQCRQLFADILSKARISFEPDGATISGESLAVVDALAAVALRCKGVAIEVAGHTEANGIDEVNRDVSKRRAQAVVDYLTKAGADPFKLTAVGYGGAHPIAPSDSEDGRARNRRIEFLVK